MVTDPREILQFIAKIHCNPWLPPRICSSGCIDHKGTLNYNSGKSVGSLQTCRGMGRKIIRDYTKRFLWFYQEKWCQSGVYALGQDQWGIWWSSVPAELYHHLSLIHLSGKGQCSLHEQTCLDAENSRSLHFCSFGALTAQLRPHTSV